VLLDGSSYLNINAAGSTGVSPVVQTSTSTWQLFARGIAGIGTWSAGATYQINHVVTYNGATWSSMLGSNTNQNPETATTYWKKIAAKGDTGATGTTGATGAAGPGVPTGGGTGQVLAKNSATDYDTAWSTPAGGGASADTQKFLVSGTWTKPAGAKSVHFALLGGGAGGASGRRGAGSSARAGGGGGGGAGGVALHVLAADLPSTLTVNVGVGGNGGAAKTTDDTSGANGVAGTPSYVVGAVIVAYAPNGAFGVGGGTGSSLGGSGGTSMYSGGGGGSSNSAGAAGDGTFVYVFSSAGGGAGSPIPTSNAVVPGGYGGANFTFNRNTSGVTGGATAGAAGTDGPAATGALVGSGGGGGGPGIGVAAGNGGAGGGYGGGGGGGGASVNGLNSGAGGKGGDGVIVITTYF
jgi:hypothetical protein